MKPKTTAKVATIVLAALTLASCDQKNSGHADNEQADRYRSLLNFFQDTKIGMNGDFGLFKTNAFGINEPVMAVFGFADNLQICQGIADDFNKSEPNAYHCEALQRP